MLTNKLYNNKVYIKALDLILKVEGFTMGFIIICLCYNYIVLYVMYYKHKNICPEIILQGDDNVTKFEQIGINYQYDANNIYEANKAFKRSCDCCCNKGIKINCDKCNIAFVHSLVVAYFDDKKTKEK